MAFRAPLLGYNTNVRHKGRLYHIQTEDSGVGHPHIITHLFADGGRIVGSKKTSYVEHLGSDVLQDTVKKLMQGQHKAMFIALRDGLYDESPSEVTGEATGTIPVGDALSTPGGSAPRALRDSSAEPPDPARASFVEPPERKPLYQGTVPAAQASRPSPAPLPPVNPKAVAARQSIFGSDLMSEKSLDEVILSYLATDEKD
jgi:hypothetical protein